MLTALLTVNNFIQKYPMRFSFSIAIFTLTRIETETGTVTIPQDVNNKIGAHIQAYKFLYFR